MWEEIIAELMLDNITPIKSDREALKEIQTIIAAKSEAVRRHQVGTAENKNLRCLCKLCRKNRNFVQKC